MGTPQSERGGAVHKSDSPARPEAGGAASLSSWSAAITPRGHRTLPARPDWGMALLSPLSRTSAPVSSPSSTRRARSWTVYVRLRRVPGATLEEGIGAAIAAICDYSQTHPGVLRAAMTDESVIDAEGVQAVPLLQRWGDDWAKMLQGTAEAGVTCAEL